MAKEQQIRYLDDDEFVGFNLSFAIGPGGVNERGDVMLVQALLLVIGADDMTNIVKKPQKVRLPALTGYLDADTCAAITVFQVRWMHLVFPRLLDGWTLAAGLLVGKAEGPPAPDGHDQRAGLDGQGKRQRHPAAVGGEGLS